jgi:hypothetical protein
METKYFSETSAYFQWTIWRYIPEDITLHNLLFENFKLYYLTFEIKLSFINTWNFCGDYTWQTLLGPPVSSVGDGSHSCCSFQDIKTTEWEIWVLMGVNNKARFLGRNALWFDIYGSMFRRILLPSSSTLKMETADASETQATQQYTRITNRSCRTAFYSRS